MNVVEAFLIHQELIIVHLQMSEGIEVVAESDLGLALGIGEGITEELGLDLGQGLGLGLEAGEGQDLYLEIDTEGEKGDI